MLGPNESAQTVDPPEASRWTGNLGLSRPQTPGAAALVTLALTRLPVLLTGALAVTIAGTTPPPAAEALWRVSADELVNLLARWDSMFYYTIATTGYSWDATIFRHHNVVFFPLYPVLMRLGGAALGGHFLIAGLLISLAAFAGAIVVVWRLATLELGESYAWPAVLLMTTFPYALFFSAVYTESLFLLLTASAFYAMRRGRAGVVALCGFGAGLTRPNGFWLALPLLLLAQAMYQGRRQDVSGLMTARRARLLLVALTPVLGAAVFSAYLHFRFHDALAWIHGQAAWGMPLLGRPPAPDPQRLPGEAAIKLAEVVTWVGNVAAFVLAAAAILPISRRLGPAYGAWIAVNAFPPVAAHLFISLGRFAAVMFPMFFWLALTVPRSRLAAVAAAFAAGQLLLTIWFFLWQPVV
jgi:hypothetical protein